MKKNKQSVAARKIARRKAWRRFLAPRLIHPRHSFKKMPHHHTSYPMLGLLVVIVAVFCVGWTDFASGDSDGGAYDVNAIVPAVLLTAPATITYPAANASFQQTDLLVQGTCPDNSYVTLQQNGASVGMGLCQSNHTWSIQISLAQGSNVLKAQDYNLTDQAGPTTPTVTVSYQPPPPPAPAPTPTPPVDTPTPQVSNQDAVTNIDAPPPPAEPAQVFVATTTFKYKAAVEDKPYSQQIDLSGGVPPYAISIDWGDGNTSLSSQMSTGSLKLAHIFRKPGAYKHSYIITVHAVDATGKVITMQLVAIVVPLTAGTTVDTRNKADLFPDYQSFWRLAVPTFAVIFVSLSSFWMGQHRELEVMRRTAVVQHRRRPA